MTPRASLSKEKSQVFRILFMGSDPECLSITSEGDGNTPIPQFEFICETDVEKALGQVANRQVHLALVDLDCTAFEGEKVVRRLRNGLPDVPVITLTGEAPQAQARRAIEHGAHDCLVKGEITAPLLLRTARHHVEQARLRRSLREKDKDLGQLALRYQAILRSTPNGLCMLAPDWTIQWANPTLSRILSPGVNTTIELVGVSFRSLFAREEEFESYRASAPVHMGMEGVDIRQVALRRLDDTPFCGEISIVLLDPAETAPGYVVTLADKSQEVRAWEELKWMSSVSHQTADSVFVTDRNGIIVYVNPAFESVTGYSAAEAMGKSPGDLIKSSRHDSEFYARLWETILAGRVYRAVFTNRRKNGAFYFEEETITPVRDQDGEISHFISTGRDITERREAEETIRLSEEKFRVQFKSVPVPTFVWKKEGEDFVLTDYNDAAYRLSRGRVIDIMGKALHHVYHDQPDVRSCVTDCYEMKQTIQREVAYRFFSTGEVRMLMATTAFVPPDSVLVHTEDITERQKAERDLRDSEARYRAIVQDQLDLICRFTPDGILTFVNEAVCRLRGSSSKDLVGKPILSFAHEDDQDSLRREIGSLTPEDPVHMVESRLRFDDGTVRWYQWTHRLITNDAGQVVEHQAVGRDITDRKRAEETLRLSERRFATVFHSTTVPISIASVDEGRYLDVNESFLQMTGFTREEIVGHTSTELGLWLNNYEREALTRKVREHGRLHAEPLDIRVRSGEIRSGLISLEFVEFEGVQYLLAIFQDITELRLAERALRESEARNRAILDAMPDTMFLVTYDGVYIDYHTPEPDTLLAPPEKFMFRPQREILPPELNHQYEALFRDVIATGQMQVMEFSVTHRERQMHFEARVAPCGENQLLKVVRNITEERNLREQLLATERLAAVGQTAAIAAHCMKNIFTALKGSVSLLARAVDTQDLQAARQAQQLLDKSTTRLHMLFMEMLDYSKQRQPNLKPVEIKPLLDEVVDLLHLIDHKETNIEFEVEEEAATAILDRDWIFRTLVNLGSNALDALPYSGRIDLRAYVASHNGDSQETDKSTSPSEFMILEVEDNGSGISDTHLPQIFRPLFTTKESRGTGLGLACVRQFVESMGGRIEVSTKVDVGTRFRLVFPMHQEFEPGKDSLSEHSK